MSLFSFLLPSSSAPGQCVRRKTSPALTASPSGLRPCRLLRRPARLRVHLDREVRRRSQGGRGRERQGCRLRRGRSPDHPQHVRRISFVPSGGTGKKPRLLTRLKLCTEWQDSDDGDLERGEEVVGRDAVGAHQGVCAGRLEARVGRSGRQSSISAFWVWHVTCCLSRLSCLSKRQENQDKGCCWSNVGRLFPRRRQRVSALAVFGSRTRAESPSIGGRSLDSFQSADVVARRPIQPLGPFAVHDGESKFTVYCRVANMSPRCLSCSQESFSQYLIL